MMNIYPNARDAKVGCWIGIPFSKLFSNLRSFFRFQLPRNCNYCYRENIIVSPTKSKANKVVK